MNGELTSGGQAVTVTVDGDSYIGTRADGSVVFTLEINDDGTYEFEALLPLDHGDQNDPDDRIELTFGVVVTDFDGDMAMTNITIRFDDDGLAVEVPEGTVDETDLGGDGATSTSGDITVDFGADGGRVEANGDFDSSGSRTDNTLTSNGVPVVVTQVGDVYTGTANGEVIFTMTINVDTLDYDFVLLGTLDHADGNNPNDIITLSFGVDAVGSDGTRQDATINIRVLDDAPIANDDGGQTASPDEVVVGNVTDNDTVGEDGNENPVISVRFDGQDFPVAPGQTTSVVGQFGTLVIDAQGEYSYTPLGNVEGTDQFQYTIQDGDGDTDTATAFLSLSVDGVPDVPNGPIATIDETDFDNGGNTVSGEFDVDFGLDGPSTTDPFAPSGADGFSFGGSTGDTLTSWGREVSVGVEADSYVGRTDDGTVVFELSINDDGTYEFTAFETLDHADSNNPNDRIELNFDVTVTDFDGDQATTEVTVNFDDDGPTVTGRAGGVNEQNLADGPLVVNRDLTIDFGEDGPAADSPVSPTGQFFARFEVGGQDQDLTSGGDLVNVTATDNGYVGVAGGRTVFTITINDAGESVYTQLEPIDHPRQGEPGSDRIWIGFEFSATDHDGDQAVGRITFDIQDGLPTAVDDGNQATEGDAITGNIFANDEIGPDGNDNPVTLVRLNGEDFTVSSTGNTTIDGQFGVLVINAQGTYTYTPNAGVEGVDNFTYAITDGDGDTDTATFSFTVSNDDVPVITIDGMNMVDETDLGDGVLRIDSRVDVDFGGDNPGVVSIGDAAAFTVSGSNAGALTSGGEVVTVAANGTSFVGALGDGTVVFTLNVAADGNYWYRQFEPLDHADGTDPNDQLNLNFQIQATDADGDVATSVLSIGVKDDGPTVTGRAGGVNEQNLADGPLVVNRDLTIDFGEDGPAADSPVSPTGQFFARFEVGGQDQDLTSGGDLVNVTATDNGYVGVAGGRTVFTITINDAGESVYTQLEPIDHPRQGEPGSDRIWIGFEFSATDHDGDQAVGRITFDIQDGLPTAVDDGNQATEGDAITGNIFANDEIGPDGNDNPVTLVRLNGEDFTVSSTGNTTIDGQFGVLVINAQGTYTYTPNAGVEGVDNFTYAITDGDGDTDTATFSFTVSQPIPEPIQVDVSVDDVWIFEDGEAFVPVQATYEGGDGNELVTLTLTGVEADWGFVGQGWTANADGSFQIVLPAGTNSFDGGFTLSPPADSDVDLTGLEVTSSVFDPDTGTTVQGDDTFDALVDAVVDPLNVNVRGDGVFDVSFGASDRGLNTFTLDSIYLNTQDNSETISFAFINLNSTVFDGHSRAEGVTPFEAGWRVTNPGAIETASGVYRIPIDLQQTDFVLQITVDGNNRELPTHRDLTVPILTHFYSGEYNPSDAEKPGDEFPNNVVVTSVTQTARTFITPLVLDLDGDGIELTSIEDGTLFDLNNDGILDRTGFVAADDGLLALDRDGDGIINNQSELFGNSDMAEDGFARLAELDSNEDGIFDAQDNLFDDVVIFQDLNQNGVSDEGELLSLSDHGIASIDLNALDLEATGDELFLAGNIISDVSTFTRVDGSVGEIVDALFQTELGTLADTFNEETGIFVNSGVDVVDQEVLDGFSVASLSDAFADAQQDVFSSNGESGEGDDSNVIDIASVLAPQDAITDWISQEAGDVSASVGEGHNIVALPLGTDVLQGIGFGHDDVWNQTDTGL